MWDGIGAREELVRGMGGEIGLKSSSNARRNPAFMRFGKKRRTEEAGGKVRQGKVYAAHGELWAALAVRFCLPCSCWWWLRLRYG